MPQLQSMHDMPVIASEYWHFTQHLDVKHLNEREASHTILCGQVVKRSKLIKSVHESYLTAINFYCKGFLEHQN